MFSRLKKDMSFEFMYGWVKSPLYDFHVGNRLIEDEFLTYCAYAP